jgi:hypothetical protein
MLKLNFWGVAMARRPTAKKRLEKLFELLKILQQRTHKKSVAFRRRKRRRVGRKLVRALARPVKIAFEKAGLDVDNDKHWRQLLLWFAWAHYGKKGPGHPKKWTLKKLRRLLNDVDEMRAKNPGLKESTCCERLSKGDGGNGRYKDMKDETIRRVLQRAKALENEAQMLTIPVQDVLLTHSANPRK